ncbi:MAG: FliH/SctL family protein [Planctomycetales bacterium]
MSSTETKRVLKADAVRQLGAKIAFNYEDFRTRCDEHLAEVRCEAGRILDEARREAAKVRESAFAEGRNAGRAAGLRDADRLIDERAAQLTASATAEKLAHVVPALRAAADELARERDRWLETWETNAVRLAVAVAEKLVRRELELHPEAAFESAAAALELAAGCPRIELRMHPADVELTQEHGEQVLRALAACGEARLVADESVGRGGCVVRTIHGTIDGRLETQLERITAELLQGGTSDE